MRKALPGVMLAVAMALPTAGACGLHGTINNPFAISYPGSLGVALFTQQAIQQQQLMPLPELENEAASERLGERLGQLRARLEKASFKGKFVLLVIDSGHWVRFSASGERVNIAAHAQPAIDDPVLLTSESALAALLDGQLGANAAEQAGLVRWSGHTPPSTLTQTWRAALANGT